MKSSLIRLGMVCLLVILLTSSCQAAEKAFIPLTGGNIVTAPAQVVSARDSILAYLIASSRLENTPPKADWQLDPAEQRNGEYRFLSGDWVLVVWSANEQEENQRVILRDKGTHAVWCGYIQPDGHIVDTSYLP